MFCSLQPGVVALFDGVYSVVVTIALSCALWLFTPWILVVFTLLSWLFVMCFVVVTAAALGATLAEPAGDAGQ